MAEDQTPSEGGANEEAGARKELDGFQVTRSAPAQAEGNPMLIPFVIVVLLALGGGFAAVKLSGGGDDDGTSGTTGTGATTGGTDSGDQPADEEVPDYVWDRLEFLEGEGNYEKALEVAEEAHELTPNSKLRVKMAQYRKDLGLEFEDLTLPQALARSRASLKGGRLQEAIDFATTAIDLSDDESAEAYLLRGTAYGRSNDKLRAVEDLEAALELGYEPAAEVEALLEKYE